MANGREKKRRSFWPKLGVPPWSESAGPFGNPGLNGGMVDTGPVVPWPPGTVVTVGNSIVLPSVLPNPKEPVSKPGPLCLNIAPCALWAGNIPVPRSDVLVQLNFLQKVHELRENQAKRKPGN